MSNDSPAAEFSPKRVLIVGLGLLGGAVAHRVRAAFPEATITAVVRSETKYAAAIEAGLVDRVVARFDPVGDSDVPTDEWTAAVACDLAVIATPVDRIFSEALTVLSLSPDSLITDVGSTKAALVRQVEEANDADVDLSRFVPAHPLAGSERTGWPNADPELLVGATCVLTPHSDAAPDAVASVDAFWRSLGMRTLHADAGDHDRWLAQSSHLPHIAAAALVRAIDAPEAMRATGYADTTRVAAGSPEIWRSIVASNPQPIRDALDRLRNEVDAIDALIAEGNWDAVESWLAAAAAERRSRGR